MTAMPPRIIMSSRLSLAFITPFGLAAVLSILVEFIFRSLED